MKEKLERRQHVTGWTWKHNDRLGGIYGIYLKLMKEKLGMMSTCNRLDLETQWSFGRNLWNIPQINEGKIGKDVNM